MLFHTLPFVLIFLPVTLAAYYAAADHVSLRQWILLSASLTFYSVWDVRFLPLLLAQVTITWALAKVSDNGRQLWPIALGIFVNLLSLATFKYLDFAIKSLEQLIGSTLPHAGLILPIGISFFTFQLVSYLVDLRRGQSPIYDFRRLALFVSVFPHLIAGPIVRHNELIPQFDQDPRRKGVERRFVIGSFLFALGFVKKVFVADPLSAIADPLFVAAGQRMMTMGEAWTAALSFSFQLFLDFSAYTEMATGAALMFGLILPENFNRPYIARNLREFWRRWHISLSNFIRDYVYIPMGGSRNGQIHYVFATIGSMAICGLWHGAGWTFVIWGVLHGAGLVVCRAWQSLNMPLPGPLAWLITMLFVMIGWVLFRSQDLSTMGNITAALVGFSGMSGTIDGLPLLIAGAVLATIVPSAHNVMKLQDERSVWALIATTIACTTSLVFAGHAKTLSFLYFQF